MVSQQHAVIFQEQDDSTFLGVLYINAIDNIEHVTKTLLTDYRDMQKTKSLIEQAMPIIKLGRTTTCVSHREDISDPNVTYVDEDIRRYYKANHHIQIIKRTYTPMTTLSDIQHGFSEIPMSKRKRFNKNIGHYYIQLQNGSWYMLKDNQSFSGRIQDYPLTQQHISEAEKQITT